MSYHIAALFVLGAGYLAFFAILALVFVGGRFRNKG